VAPETQAGERYATQVGELWSGLSQTLVRLEGIALAPERLDDEEMVDVLQGLQYSLHTASESVLGLSPPADAEPAHSELAAALAGARDATGEVVEVVAASGSRGLDPMLYEWRGALFRVRLARLRLTGPPPTAPARSGSPLPRLHAPSSATALTIGGTASFVLGATLELWPVWAAGLLAVCVSLLLYRP
jgi:hypothetical protein